MARFMIMRRYRSIPSVIDVAVGKSSTAARLLRQAYPPFGDTFAIAIPGSWMWRSSVSNLVLRKLT
ncbi:hypothetical protein CH292_26435 [Rhodococcus sp. 14-2470-1a]|nr:hypothetical protein CH292_26435 [Rhodococcus sp. 14-2470-1a]